MDTSIPSEEPIVGGSSKVVLDPARRVIWTQFGYASFLEPDDRRHEEVWRHTDDPRAIFLGIPAPPEASVAGV